MARPRQYSSKPTKPNAEKKATDISFMARGIVEQEATARGKKPKGRHSCR